MPNVSNLVKKPDNDAKMSDFESKCFTTVKYNNNNKLKNQKLDLKRKQIELADQSVIADLVKTAELYKKKLTTLTTKAELKAEQYKIVKFFIYFFRQCTNILNRLVILIIFQHRKLKDCLMKLLRLLFHLIIVLLLD